MAPFSSDSRPMPLLCWSQANCIGASSSCIPIKITEYMDRWGFACGHNERIAYALARCGFGAAPSLPYRALPLSNPHPVIRCCGFIGPVGICLRPQRANRICSRSLWIRRSALSTVSGAAPLKSPPCYSVLWVHWTGGDLNPRPPHCKCGDLAELIYRPALPCRPLEPHSIDKYYRWRSGPVSRASRLSAFRTSALSSLSRP